MCKYIINKLELGQRELGYELWNGKEIIEMTSKQIRDALKAKEDIRGLRLGENGIDMELDSEDFFTTNIMVKSHINNLRPLIQNECCMSNVFYIVTEWKQDDKENKSYEVISSRFERTSITEAKLSLMLEMGFITGGAKLKEGKIILPNISSSSKVNNDSAKVKTSKADKE